MKIFHLLSARVWGGEEVYALTLAKHQREHGHSVEIICANRPQSVSKFREAGFKVHTMQLHGHINLFSPFRIADLLRRDPDTIIHVHKISDTPLATKAINLISRKNRPGFICTHHLVAAAPTKLKFQKTYQLIDKIICVSNKSKETLLSSETSLKPEKIQVILNSTDRIADTNKAAQPILKGNNLLFMGRIIHDKGVDTIIEALPLLPDCTFTICGSGNQEYISYLHGLAKSLDVEDRINWVGFTDNITHYISQADIGIVPSRCEEACALVNFEFMAAGVPLVTSNTGAQPEIITDGVDGFLVPPDNPHALANTIQRLIDDPALRLKMGEAARKTFENRFTYDKFYNEVMNVYDDVLNSKA